MEIQFTSDQILALAPDSSSASAGKKLGSAKHWKSLGNSADALWGECQGSALYQVKVELASLASHCSCPSRKLPCKHCLGLLLIAATNQAAVSEGEPPEWVVDWLAKRQASSVRKQERATKVADQPPSANQLKTAEKRLVSVKKGLDGLDLWLNDLVRQGLASVQTQPASFWEHQAARLRDAQAPALDTRVRRLSAIPNASPDWPEKLLDELGKIALLTHAFRQEEQLEPGMREEVRQLIGWSLNQEEVNTRGEIVRDDWLVVGQAIEDAERGRTQRTWLSGLTSGRIALILQFSFAGQPFAEHFVIGSHQEAELAFWPGAYPQRAQVRARLASNIQTDRKNDEIPLTSINEDYSSEKAPHIVSGAAPGMIAPFQGEWPGMALIDEFLNHVANALGRQPWLERFFCSLREVTPVCSDNGTAWFVRDKTGCALPLTAGDHWLLLALSGGYPLQLIGEWSGGALLPLGALVDGLYTPFGRVN